MNAPVTQRLPVILRFAAATAEWIICLPCLFLSSALHLYLAGALLVLTFRLFVRRYLWAARLRGLANLMITLTGVTLLFNLTTPWLLTPGALLANARLAIVLASTPLTLHPIWVLTAIAAFRSLAACTDHVPLPVAQPRLRRNDRSRGTEQAPLSP